MWSTRQHREFAPGLPRRVRALARPATPTDARVQGGRGALRSRRADLLALSGLAIVFAVVVSFTWLTWGHMAGDAGFDLYAGARLAEGSLPYRDYVYYYGPLVPALLAVDFAVFGATLSAAIGFGLLVAWGIVVTTYALARRRLSPTPSFLCAAFVAAAVVARPDPVNAIIPTVWSGSLGALGLLVAILCAERYFSRPTATTSTLAGIAVGVEAIVKPEYFVYLVLGLALLLVVRWRARVESMRALWPGALVALAIPLVAYGAVLVLVPARDLVQGLVPSSQLSASGFHAYRAESPLDASHLIRIVARAVAYVAAACALAFAGARLLTRRPPVAAVGALVGAAMIFLAVGLITAAPGHERVVRVASHLTHTASWLSVLVACVFVMLLVRAAWPALRHRTPPTISDQGLLLVAAVATLTVNQRYVALAPGRSLSLVVPLGVVLLAQLHLHWLPRGSAGAARAGLAFLAILACAALIDVTAAARLESVVVHAPRGDFRASPADAGAYQGAIDALARLGPRASVVAGPQAAALLFLTGDRTPLRQVSLLPGAFESGRAEDRAAQGLERRPPSAAVITYQNLEWFGQTRFGVSFMRRLYAALRRSLPAAATYRGRGPDALVIEVRTRG
jgi:hypothetical protein